MTLAAMKTLSASAVFIACVSPMFCNAEVPSLLREKSFSCTDLVEAANYYIALREDRALEALQLLANTQAEENPTQLEHFSRTERIGWILRLIFTPDDKAIPRPLFGSFASDTNHAQR